MRQGTIDQDQEFISFLESLTNPIVKPTPVDQNNDLPAKNGEKTTVTPLVQFLKDKKANKGKDPTPASKSTKHTRQDSKDNTNGSVLEKRLSTKMGNASLLPERQNVQAIKIEKATREVVQVIQQQVAEVIKNPLPSPVNVAEERTEKTSNVAKSTPRTEKTPNIVKPASAAEKTPIIAKPTAANEKPNIAKPIAATEKTTSTARSTPGTEKRRERGSASAAAKILQRDLGLGTSPRGRGTRRGISSGTPKPTASNADPTVPKEESLLSSSSIPSKDSAASTGNNATSIDETPALVPSSNVTSKPQEPAAVPQPPKGPATSRTSPKAASASDAKAASPQNSSKTINKDIPVSPTATQAFLKHANPSQGITETLLEEAFAEFGAIKKVEIDKKKGFGYIDFTEPKSLLQAIKASPIKVGQGQVVVLERKMGPTLQARNARGGSSVMANRGGSPVGPRGGRGGAIRRGGGASRGGTNITNSTASKGVATSSPAPANVVRNAEAPISYETNPQSVPGAMSEPATLPTPTSKSASDVSHLPES